MAGRDSIPGDVAAEANERGGQPAARRWGGSFWPSATQRLMLEVGLAPPGEAANAWRQLRGRFPLETLEPGSFVFLPLMYRALARDGVRDDRIERMKGIYRSTFYRNGLLLERSRETINALAEHGVEATVTGSIASAVRFYDDVGLRPMSGFELLIPAEMRDDAVAAARAVGWQPSGDAAGEPVWLADGANRTCVIRTRVAPDFAGATAALLDRAVHVNLGGERARVLTPGDELLAACVAGARVRPVVAFQWLLDVAQILIHEPTVDWETTVATAAAHAQTMRLNAVLDYVAALPRAVVPDEARARLGGVGVSTRERLGYALSARGIPALGGLPQTLGEHVTATSSLPVRRAFAGLPAHLRSRWGLAHSWQLPLAAGRKAVRVARRRG